MSHSSATVKFSDGLVLYGEYNGTVDLMLWNLYPTMDKMIEHWHQQQPKECSGHESETVEAHADYGNGIDWKATACRQCMVFLKPNNPIEHKVLMSLPSKYW